MSARLIPNSLFVVLFAAVSIAANLGFILRHQGNDYGLAASFTVGIASGCFWAYSAMLGIRQTDAVPGSPEQRQLAEQSNFSNYVAALLTSAAATIQVVVGWQP